jgi:V/A-type H+-transporting ATPase subunit D
MSEERLPATRATLLRTRRQLAQVDKGTELLHRKREALVRELFRLARAATDARQAIADRMAAASPSLLEALTVHGAAGLRALSWPTRDLVVDLAPALVWGIPASDVREVPPVRRSVEARALAPGSAGPAAADAAYQFELVLELLLAAAPAEQRLRRLGSAVSDTGRRLRTLEERVAPALSARIVGVRRTLDEREREEHLRLQHVKRRLQGRTR